MQSILRSSVVILSGWHAETLPQICRPSHVGQCGEPGHQRCNNRYPASNDEQDTIIEGEFSYRQNQVRYEKQTKSRCKEVFPSQRCEQQDSEKDRPKQEEEPKRQMDQPTKS